MSKCEQTNIQRLVKYVMMFYQRLLSLRVFLVKVVQPMTICKGHWECELRPEA